MIHLILERYLFYSRKFVELWLGAEPRNLFKGLLKRSAIVPLPCKQTFLFHYFIVNKENFHKQIRCPQHYYK